MIYGLFVRLLLLYLSRTVLTKNDLNLQQTTRIILLNRNYIVMSKKYNVIYAADNAFCGIMGVSIISLLENNKNAQEIDLTILNNGISKNNKEKINKLVQQYGRAKPNWVNAINIEEKIGMRISKDRGSLSQYSRIFLNNIFDINIKRVLYLDCDTIVDGPISDLWNLNLGDNVIGALKDAFSRYYRRNIGLAPNDLMFNSGVMLIDLAKWRKYEIEEKVMNFIVQHKGRIQQGDQGVLDAVLSKYTYAISPRYNFISVFTDFSYEQMLIYRHPVNFYDKHEIEIARNNPIIIHFTSSFLTSRPWEKGCKSIYLDKWLKYKSRTPWKKMKVQNEKHSILKKVYETLPKKISLRILSVFQVYLRPWKNFLVYKFLIIKCNHEENK